MRGVACAPLTPDPIQCVSETESFLRDGSRLTTRRVRAGGRILTSRQRRDPDINTVWTIEPLLKDVDDLRAFLEVPAPTPGGVVDPRAVIKAEEQLRDTGIVMIDTPDPLCLAASLFDMAEHTVLAMTEQTLFHRLLERFAAVLWAKTEAVAEALPGRLWRIYGPEYASPPYLPPHLFDRYVMGYEGDYVERIHAAGAFVRLHCHGRVRAILPKFVALGADATDPVEAPPSGDVELAEAAQELDPAGYARIGMHTLTGDGGELPDGVVTYDSYSFHQEGSDVDVNLYRYTGANNKTVNVRVSCFITLLL